MKKLLGVGIILLLVLFLVACGDSDNQSVEVSTEPEEVEQEETEGEEVADSVEELADEPEEPQEEVDEATEEDDVSWDDLKDQDNIVGKSDKDFSDISNSKPKDVRNDTTGNWRISTIIENVDIEEYALSYYDTHMESGEVHHIVNFTRNTTTWLNELGGLLYVDVKEYVDKEEHDAKTLGSGMLLKSYMIYPDGDIEEIEIY